MGRKLNLAAILACLAALFFAGAFVQPAVAQDSGADDQYIPDPPVDDDDDDGDIGDDDDGGDVGDDSDDGGVGAAGGSGSGGDGTLPFTGYPLTVLVALMLFALLAGAMLRAYSGYRERRLT